MMSVDVETREEPIAGRNITQFGLGVVGSAVAAGAFALLIAAPREVPFGWVLLIVAVVVIPSAGFSWVFRLGAGGLLGVVSGFPMAIGLHSFIFFAVFWLHPPAGIYAMAMVVASWVVFVVGLRLRTEAVARPEYSVTRWMSVALGVLIVVGTWTVWNSGRDGDDWTYAAIVADYSVDKPLSATHPALGADIEMDSRSSLNSWLAISGATLRGGDSDALEYLQRWLPLLLAPVAMLSTFLLGSSIGRSSRWGLVALLVQLGWFAGTTDWFLPGDGFLHRLSQDKLVFLLILLPAVLAPVMLGLLKARWQLLGFSLFATAALAGVHSGMLLLVVPGLAIWASLGSFTGQKWWRQAAVVTACMALGLIVALGSGIGLADAGPGPDTEASNLLRSTHVANQVDTGRIVQQMDGNLFMVDPSLISNPITLLLAALALLAPAVRREAGTLFVAAITGTVVLIAFNPILTPRLADVLVPIQGLGMLTRAIWLLPIPFVLPALFGALERRTEKPQLWPVVVAISLLGFAQLPAFSSSIDAWRTRRIPWDGSERVVLRSATDMPGLEGVHEALAAVAQPEDTALAPPPIARRLPSHVPNLRLLEFRGLLGDLPHYPQERAAESLARAEDVKSFWRPQAQLTAEDSRILADHGVRFIVFPESDNRIASLSELGYVVIFRSDSWTLLALS